MSIDGPERAANLICQSYVGTDRVLIQLLFKQLLDFGVLYMPGIWCLFVNFEMHFAWFDVDPKGID